MGQPSIAQQPSPVESAGDEQPLAQNSNTARLGNSIIRRGSWPEWSPSGPWRGWFWCFPLSVEKQQALLQFLDDQQNRRSPEYHHRLAPAEFGSRFGAADTDTEAVRQWLRKSGLLVAPASQSRLWVEFSGTSAQVESAFHTELHYYEWAGKKYLANATDIAIPAQFAGISRGVVSLNNFGKRPPRLLPAAALTQPNLTASGPTNFNFLAPGDFSAIYNTKGLLSGGVDGTGIAIAVTAQSEIALPDVQAFRQIFIVSSQPNDPNFMVSGPDPGLVGPVDMQEAELDVEWAGAVAPGATIDLVVAASTDTTSGVDLAAAYAIDNRVAPILTYTYGACEALLTPTQNEFYNSLWQQAAAEGITVLVASGDNGAAGCDSATSGLPATRGPAVNGAAATPYNVAVGGTQFADMANPSVYWGSNNANFSSALGYISGGSVERKLRSAAAGLHDELRIRRGKFQPAGGKRRRKHHYLCEARVAERAGRTGGWHARFAGCIAGGCGEPRRHCVLQQHHGHGLPDQWPGQSCGTHAGGGHFGLHAGDGGNIGPG